jgi:hypothetical protein
MLERRHKFTPGAVGALTSMTPITCSLRGPHWCKPDRAGTKAVVSPGVFERSEKPVRVSQRVKQKGDGESVRTSRSGFFVIIDA